MHKTNSWILVLAFLTIQIVLSVEVASFGLALWFKNSIIPGVTVNNIAVGGLTPDQAVKLLQKSIPWPKSDSILILIGPDGKTWNIKCNDINLKPDYKATIVEAANLGKKNGSWSQLYSEFLRDVDLPVIFMFDQAAFRKILKSINAKYEKAPQNARLVPSSQNITVLPDSSGLVMDVEAMVNDLSNFNPQQNRLELKFKQVKPELTFEDFKDIDTRLGIYTTKLEPGTNRTHNIRLASQLLDNRLVKPGEVFSLNQTLGPRTVERGFLKAPVIVNNQMGFDYGGGICQVSTTLYLAVLQASLPIIKRVPHSIPVDYVPLGNDATIDGDNIDFQFGNNQKYPVVITSSVKKDSLIVSIYGHKDN